MQKLFKNASVVNLQNREIRNLDILVDDGKIVDFCEPKNFSGEKIDLDHNFVLPCFVNCFCDSQKAFETTFEKEIAPQTAKKLFLEKNILSGVLLINDQTGLGATLENTDELSELDFNDFAMQNAKKPTYLKVGLTLDELGSVDKTFKKPLSNVLEDFGILDKKFTIVGGNCFEKDDFLLFSQHDCDFCLTFSEDGKLGRRPNNLVSLMSHNFRFGFGSGYDFQIDYFEMIRQILMAQRSLFESKDVFDEVNILKIATSADILGLRNEIEIGETANFIVIQRGNSHYDDPFLSIVWEKSLCDLLLCVKNGEIVQKNGKIVFKNLPDYDIILNEIKRTRSLL